MTAASPGPAGIDPHPGPPARAMDEPPLVVIVDDQASVREAMIALLESAGVQAAGFADAQSLLTAALPDRPGCFVFDVRMPGSSGLELQERLVRRGETKPVIFVTGHGDVPMSIQAMKAGAVDFLVKPFRDQDLLDAVWAAISQDRSWRAEALARQAGHERVALLSPRERQVFEAVAKGALNKQIAYALGVSECTIKLHRGNAMRKLGATCLADLVRVWQTLPPGGPGDV